jgi:hypothetical protein
MPNGLFVTLQKPRRVPRVEGVRLDQRLAGALDTDHRVGILSESPKKICTRYLSRNALTITLTTSAPTLRRCRGQAVRNSFRNQFSGDTVFPNRLDWG